jgi:ankyrin repeat protein
MKTEQDRFFEAVFRDDVCTVVAALETGVDPSAKHSHSGATPLGVACEAGALAVAATLLKAGADPNARFTKSSLVTGSRHEDRVALMNVRTAPLVEMLVGAGADVNAVDGEGWSALSLATRDGLYEVVKKLIEIGASVGLQGRVQYRYGSIRGLIDDQQSHIGRLIGSGPNPKLQAVFEDYMRIRELL